VPTSPAHHKRACDHACAGIIASTFQHGNETAPQAVAGVVACLVPHDDQAAIHARQFTGQRPAEMIAGVAKNLDPAAAHASSRMRAGAAFDNQIA
jgi:hypothetical protein